MEPKATEREQNIALIKTAYETGPLYKIYRYAGLLAVPDSSLPPGVRSTSRAILKLPVTIDLFCPKCKLVTAWEAGSLDHQNRPKLAEVAYECRNCAKETTTYYYKWWEDAASTSGMFQKVGQFPPLESVPPSYLQLSKEDVGLYKRALVSRNYSFGLGALAYLRRIVENQMNALLELVAGAVVATGDPEINSNELNRLRSNGTFAEKAAFAHSVLPNHLKPGGHNPFQVILDFANKGIHAGNEDECLDEFDNVRTIFEYLFRNLTFESVEAKSYCTALALLSGKKRA